MKYASFRQKEDGIALITYSNPPVNAVNIAGKNELSSLFETINTMDEVECVILAAEGKGFMSGSDVKEFSKFTHETLSIVQEADARLFSAIVNCRVPVIAAVQGYCLALGIFVASLCDFVVATEDAFFGAPEIKVGITGAASILTLFVPEKLARYMAFTGKYLSAQDLLSHGGVLSVTSREALMDECMRIAHEVTDNYTLSVQYIKAGMAITNDFHAIEKYKVENRYAHMLLDDPNREELLKAFAEKRKPRFHKMNVHNKDAALMRGCEDGDE